MKSYLIVPLAVLCLAICLASAAYAKTDNSPATPQATSATQTNGPI